MSASNATPTFSDMKPRRAEKSTLCGWHTDVSGLWRIVSEGNECTQRRRGKRTLGQLSLAAGGSAQQRGARAAHDDGVGVREDGGTARQKGSSERVHCAQHRSRSFRFQHAPRTAAGHCRRGAEQAAR